VNRLKEGVRYIAIASGPIGKGATTLLIGVIFRDNYIEGLLSTKIRADGADSTDKIIKMIRRSRFRAEVRILLLNGIALAGLNIINPQELEKRLRVKVVLLNRRRQNASELVNALNEFSRATKTNVMERIAIVEESRKMNTLTTNGLSLQSSLDGSYLKKFAKSAFEALRVAHIIARGISTGESKGRL
jgi:endonuclease V-like protein UPF0215 family